MQKSIQPERTFRSGILSVFFITAVVLGLWRSTASAQSGIGSIQGTVTDPTGALVPGAAIHVVNEGTHVALDTKSNDAGFFQAPGLFTGTYRVTVKSPGMKEYETSIELLVAQTAVINPKLEVGAETQQVIVNADTVQLTTNDSASISSTLENERINQLPENGRVLTTLLNATTPGLENGGTNMNGMNPASLDYVVDGANLTSNNAGGLLYPQTELIDPDSIQEVHVQASNGGAQYATPATVIMSTRSGTRNLHGTMFETARNNAFGVATPRGVLPGTPTPQLIRNEFGVSAGGPVVIPHVYHGRSKTFWFFAYERFSKAQQTPGLTAVPTYGTPGMTGPGAGMNNGDFSTLVSKAGVLQTLYNPATTANASKCAATGAANAYCRTPFPNNQIPLSEESPFAKVYYDIIPKPNVPGVTNPLIQNNLSYSSPTYQVAVQETARIDHEFNENNRTFVRFSHSGSPVNIAGGPDNLAADGIPSGAALGFNNNLNNNYSTSLDYTHVFSPTFFAETIYSMQWFSSDKIPGADLNTDYESMLGLPNNFGEAGFPAIKGIIQPLTSSQTNNQANDQINAILDENLTKTIGRHQLLFGGRFSHIREAVLPNGTADSVTYGANEAAVYQPTSKLNYTALANTGNADAAMFLGGAGSYVVNLQTPHTHIHLNELDSYVQDDFHVSKKLTLNLGLRYEARPAMWTKGGVANSFDFKNDAIVLSAPISQLIAEGYTTQAIITNDQNIGVKFETAQAAGFPSGSSLMNNYDLNFLPRLGVAWIPFRKGTVIRGGFGQYMNASPLLDYATHFVQNNPFKAQYTQSYSTAAQAIDSLPNELLRYNDPVQFPVTGLNTANIVNTNVTNAILPGGTLWSSSPNFKPIEVNEFNVTIEQPLPGRSALRVTYLYSHSANLDVQDGYNNQPTNYQYEMAYGQAPPTGGASVIGTPQQNTYSATATGPYDQTTWGANNWESKSGWSNYNALQVNYQRLYHHGLAYQISYVYGKSMKAGGDVVGGAAGNVSVSPYANYPGALGTVSQMSLLPGSSTPYAGAAPPALPSGTPVWQDYRDMDRFQLYQLDASIPKMDIKFNGIYDLPVGRGKRFLRQSPRWLDEIVGGLQISGLGSVVSQVFNPASTMWGQVSPIHVYKHKNPVTDCRSGVCVKGYQWFNGYLSPLVIGANCTKAPACVSGVPTDYQPYQTWLNNDPTQTAYFASNDVTVTFPNGSPNTVAYDAGPTGSNYTSKTYLNGPVNWIADLSLFKVFPIKNEMNLRVNFDAFNAFNHQGNTNPDPTDGIANSLASYNTSRQLQITARLTF
jgi:Carboxypeptidase regulatory-like domain